MNEEQLILKLIEMIQSTSETIWSAAVRQALVGGVFNAILFLVTSISAFFLIREVVKKWYEMDTLDTSQYKREDDIAGMIIVFSVLAAICVVVASVSLNGAMSCLISPEFKAIQLLAATLK